MLMYGVMNGVVKDGGEAGWLETIYKVGDAHSGWDGNVGGGRLGGYSDGAMDF